MIARLFSLVRGWPLLAFLCVGGFAWAVVELIVPTPHDRIVIDARTAQAVVETRADLLGRDLSPEERAVHPGLVPLH